MTQEDQIDRHATGITFKRYERLSCFYDLIENFAESCYHIWREHLGSLVYGKSLLEIGVGTGKNMPYHTVGAHITGIDLTPGMLAVRVNKEENIIET